MILQNVEEKECETENKIDRISKGIVFTDLWSKNRKTSIELTISDYAFVEQIEFRNLA